MKLILAIMSNDDSPAVSSALTKENYQVTRLATTGGFLRAGNTTLIVGTDDDKIERAIEVGSLTVYLKLIASKAFYHRLFFMLFCQIFSFIIW